MVTRTTLLSISLILPTLLVLPTYAQDFMSFEEYKQQVAEANAKHHARDNFIDKEKSKQLFFSLSNKNSADENSNGSNNTSTSGDVNTTGRPQSVGQSLPASTAQPGGVVPNPDQDGAMIDNKGNIVLPSTAGEGSGVNQAGLLSPFAGNHDNAATDTPVLPSATGNAGTAPSSANKAAKKHKKSHKPASSNLTENLYIAPPPINAGQATTFSYNNHSSALKFGIWSASWLTVSLKREISSADTGTIELILDEPFFGEYRMLPKGTVFSAVASFNSGTQRVNLTVITARLPDGTEFAVSATAYDLQERNGLVGVIVRDRGSEVADAMGEAAVDIGKKTMGLLTPNNLIGAGVDTVSNSLIENENTYRPKKSQAVSVVSRQTLKLKIDKSF